MGGSDFKLADHEITFVWISVVCFMFSRLYDVHVILLEYSVKIVTQDLSPEIADR